MRNVRVDENSSARHQGIPKRTDRDGAQMTRLERMKVDEPGKQVLALVNDGIARMNVLL